MSKPEPIVDSQPWVWPKVLIGIPMERFCHYLSLDGIVQIAMNAGVKGWEFIHFRYGRSDNQRNSFVEYLLANPRFEYLVMLDSDHRHSGTLVNHFVQVVMAKPEIKFISGLNFRRGEPWEPVAYQKRPDGKYAPLYEWGKGLVKVDAVGGAAFMVHREVYESLASPWFFRTYTIENGRVVYHSEDINFCEKVRKAGYDIWVHTQLISPHLYMDQVGDISRFQRYVQEQDDPEAQVLTGEEIRKGRKDGGRSKATESDSVWLREYGGHGSKRDAEMAGVGADSRRTRRGVSRRDRGIPLPEE